MKYTEYRVFAGAEGLDWLVERLTALDLPDLQIDDPAELEAFSGDGTDFGWNYVDESVLSGMGRPSAAFYLPEGEALSPEAEAFLAGRETVKNAVDDGLWMNRLHGCFEPTRYGERVVVKPDWAEYEAREGDIVIDIDPGQAFGTGGSPTTSLAMGMLEKLVKPGDRVLDVGCGTGILSILAARLGASEVKAVDIDPLAVECAKRNAELNGCGETVSVEWRDLVKGVDFTADVVAANLTLDILKMLFGCLKPVLAPDCTLIASGIITERAEEALEEIRKAGFRPAETAEEGEWTAVLAVRQA